MDYTNVFFVRNMQRADKSLKKSLGTFQANNSYKLLTICPRHALYQSSVKCMLHYQLQQDFGI